MSALEIILLGWLLMAVAMAGLWTVQRWAGLAGIVDVGWGLGVGLLATWFSFTARVGDPARRVLVAALALVWAMRLSGHVLARLLRGAEDSRYQALKERWGPKAQRHLFWFFQIQASWSVLFALPMFVAARNPLPLGPWDALGVAIWLVAVLGEAAADRQLSRFRADPAQRGQVCRSGLWRYSRHPNYFFEWLHWWTYVPLSLGAAWGWSTLAGPAVMLWFLLKVTGVPPTEAASLRSRGAAYREYQRTTSVFFPWPPRP